MKELIKSVVNDEDEVVIQALCEKSGSGCSFFCGDLSVEEEDEIIF
ncbi:MAG: hypothetical protein LBB90_00825 [Tannerella sp.]|jgi:hypothetical protein|nr:hypothetical protein [Tannerella sp.]